VNGAETDTLTNSLFNRVYEKFEGKCFYCGGHGSELEHVVPYSAGGKKEFSNLVLSCLRCNRVAWGWHFSSLEEKKRYILIYRFVGRNEGRKFRENVGAIRGSKI